MADIAHQRGALVAGGDIVADIVHQRGALVAGGDIVADRQDKTAWPAVPPLVHRALTHSLTSRLYAMAGGRHTRLESSRSVADL